MVSARVREFIVIRLILARQTPIWRYFYRDYARRNG